MLNPSIWAGQGLPHTLPRFLLILISHGNTWHVQLSCHFWLFNRHILTMCGYL